MSNWIINSGKGDLKHRWLHNSIPSNKNSTILALAPSALVTRFRFSQIYNMIFWKCTGQIGGNNSSKSGYWCSHQASLKFCSVQFLETDQYNSMKIMEEWTDNCSVCSSRRLQTVALFYATPTGRTISMAL